MQQGQEKLAGKDLQVPLASSCAYDRLLQPRPTRSPVTNTEEEEDYKLWPANKSDRSWQSLSNPAICRSFLDISRAIWSISLHLDVQTTVMSRQEIKASLLHSIVSLVYHTMLSLTGSSLIASLSSRV